MSPRMIESIAGIAHQLWCEDMIREGWTRGPFEPARKRHDALVPFERLNAQDKRHAMTGVEALELDRTLRSAIEYQRGADREFTLAEMRVGLRVGLADPEQPSGHAPVTGTIREWKADADGVLTLIRVRWDDGEESEHDPVFRELIRLDA
jgi:RyR domain